MFALKEAKAFRVVPREREREREIKPSILIFFHHHFTHSLALITLTSDSDFNPMAVNHSAVSSPWNQIVAAAATAAAPPPSSSPPPSAAVVHTSIVNSAPVDDSDNAAGGQNVNTVKRQVWNKPSNAASSSVMGAESWPALSESARSPAKSPLESVKAVTDSATLPSLQVEEFSPLFQ